MWLPILIAQLLVDDPLLLEEEIYEKEMKEAIVWRGDEDREENPSDDYYNIQRASQLLCVPMEGIDNIDPFKQQGRYCDLMTIMTILVLVGIIIYYVPICIIELIWPVTGHYVCFSQW